MYMIVNMTPHPIRLMKETTPDVIAASEADRWEVRTYPPSGEVARVREADYGPQQADYGVPVRTIAYGGVVGLPPEQRGVRHVVSKLTAVRDWHGPWRDDLIVPHGRVADHDGRTIGWRGFAQPEADMDMDLADWPCPPKLAHAANWYYFPKGRPAEAPLASAQWIGWKTPPESVESYYTMGLQYKHWYVMPEGFLGHAFDDIECPSMRSQEPITVGAWHHLRRQIEGYLDLSYRCLIYESDEVAGTAVLVLVASWGYQDDAQVVTLFEAETGLPWTGDEEGARAALVPAATLLADTGYGPKIYRPRSSAEYAATWQWEHEEGQYTRLCLHVQPGRIHPE